MIKSANQYPIHQLLSHDANVMYRVPPYQREYSWQKAQWEDLFQDLVEAEGSHFLGTIITLNQTTDAVQTGVLEVIDGQQRLTTVTLLLAAVYATLKANDDELDDDDRTDVVNLGRDLVRKADGLPRLTPQRQGHNDEDYRRVLSQAGLPVTSTQVPYFGLRRMAKCFAYFRESIHRVADTEGIGEVKAALRLLDAVRHAVIVKIEVASTADAFVLFESLNNRGMPLTPVDLIKNHLLAEAERKGALSVDEAFASWNVMLTNLGDTYATQERFLRQYYNAFKNELPAVSNAPVATRTKLIRIYETLLASNIAERLGELVRASALYGRITGTLEVEPFGALDERLRQLARAQGSPSYVLLLWLLDRVGTLEVNDAQLCAVVDRLISFFVRRNLTGYPQTYALPRLFMTIVDRVGGQRGEEVLQLVTDELRSASADDEEFRKRLQGAIYDENTDVARFILTTLAEDAMTKETRVDLWAQEKGHFVWTIEHVLPQGSNLPQAWKDMLGGAEAASAAQEAAVHRLGNLTITAYNSTLSNKGFLDKRDRTDSQGRPIGYRNGLSLNSDLAQKNDWTVADIEHRTQQLAEQVIDRFAL